jgi:hypothetical protein
MAHRDREPACTNASCKSRESARSSLPLDRWLGHLYDCCGMSWMGCGGAGRTPFVFGLFVGVFVAGCGGGKNREPPVEVDDLDVPDQANAARAQSRCHSKCQTVDWVGKGVISALTEIAACLPSRQDVLVSADLSGSVTVAFRGLPCLAAIERVAHAAGLEARTVTVQKNSETLRVLAVTRPAQTRGRLVLLPKPDGSWNPAGRTIASDREPRGRSADKSKKRERKKPREKSYTERLNESFRRGYIQQRCPNGWIEVPTTTGETATFCR